MPKYYRSSAGDYKTKEEWLAWVKPIFHEDQKTKQSGVVEQPRDIWHRCVNVLDLTVAKKPNWKKELK